MNRTYELSGLILMGEQIEAKAGIDLYGNWLGLYPVSFRTLDQSRKFWNLRLVNLVTNALPIQSDKEAARVATSAICQGTADIAPNDPIEGILIAQLMAANEASLSMYRRGWSQPPEYFEARMKYLQLADKAARTVMMLTERLDHHRGRGQQQITVKHVTTNNVTADQAIIADSVTTGGARGNVASPALLAASSEAPMPILSETGLDRVGAGGGIKSK